jgi:hypothetical protein
VHFTGKDLQRLLQCFYFSVPTHKLRQAAIKRNQQKEKKVQKSFFVQLST